MLHIDLDAFFASVEERDDPSLRGKPVLVGGRGLRGVVAAASYEARAFGCRSGMPMREALARCPKAIVATPRFERYREVSRAFRAILEGVSPLVEPLSIDEAFVDATGSQRLLGEGRAIAEEIRRRVRNELELTCSVGVAPNKFVAKLASDLEKPDGCTVIAAEDLPQRLAELPIERLWGVGPVTADRLRRCGILRFRDLQGADDDALRSLLGDEGPAWKRLALGEDDRPVVLERDPVSVGHERTFGENLRTLAEAETELAALAESVAARLRAKGFRAARVTVTIRFGDFRTITRAKTLDEPTDRTDRIVGTSRDLLRRWAAREFRPVRLLGCTAGGLAREAPQLSLFPDPADAKKEAVDRVADRIRSRFGKDAIGRATGERSRRD
jgi:DNA polymerase-4